MFKAIEALSKRLDSLGTNMERNLNLVNVNVMNMSERTTALEMKGMHIYIDFQLELYCFCFNAVCDWSMKETWASLSNKKMQNEKQVWLNDEHFSYLWPFTLSHQSSLVISFSYTVKSVLGGYLRIMAGGRPRKTGSTEKRSYKNDVKRQFEAQKFLPIGKWKVRFQRMFKDVM